MVHCISMKVTIVHEEAMFTKCINLIPYGIPLLQTQENNHLFPRSRNTLKGHLMGK